MSGERGLRARYHEKKNARPTVNVDDSVAYHDEARHKKLKNYAYGGYKHHDGHSSHYGFGYKNHYGYGYGYHYKPGFSISFSFGSYHYPYYCPPKYYGSYVRYSYGYGYCHRYRGYYTSYYDYCPPVTYRTYGGYYNVTYNTYYGSADYSAPYYEVVSSYDGVPYAQGWSSLADGKARTAFRYFSKEASRNLDDGLPKIGYAIASSMLGDDRRAIWAMRRAFIVDPYAANAIRFDEDLLTRIDALAEQFANRADSGSNPDADFMLAALSYLIEDDELAIVAIENAIARGDDSEAAANLKAMIPPREFSFEE